jgi:pullulanase
MEKVIYSPVHNMATLHQYNLYANDNQVLLKAFMKSPGKIELTLGGDEQLKSGDLELYEWDYDYFDTANNHFALINKQLPKFTQNETLLSVVVDSWNGSANYVLKYGKEMVNVFLSPALGGIIDTWFNAINEPDLGVTFVSSGIQFKVWSPPAGCIEVLLFDKKQELISTESQLWMKKAANGVFSLVVTPDMVYDIESFDGLFYQYRVYAYGKSAIALDPYSFSMAEFSPENMDNIGKGAIVNMSDPQSLPKKFSKKYSNATFMANEMDMIAYEFHVRDFTIQQGVVKPQVAGTFLGAISKIDYLKQLGITHVQLLPIMNFYTVDETNRMFSATDAPQSNYNWGYDPQSYFALEGWFSTDASNPYTRIKEFRELVQSLHDNGIGVIMDVVFNHTYLVETFENIAPGCYYRYNPDLTISGHSGAGPSLESRRVMMRKLIVESLRFFIKQYHIDGFRFDLMGFLDHETMRLIRHEVGAAYNSKDPNELILQGEAWVFSDLDTSLKAVRDEAATTKINHPRENLNLGFFNDVARDSYAGTGEQRGFIEGNYTEVDRVASAIVGGVKGVNPGPVSFNNDKFHENYNLFAEHPATCLNFLSVHDGLTLWDKINLHCSDPVGLTRARLMRLASAMLFTSQGKIILQAGGEFLRTKPLSKEDIEKDRALTSPWVTKEEGATYFHENSYCSNDFTNMIRWNRLNNQFAPIARQMSEYYKGLILMRRSIPAFRIKSADNLRNAIRFLPSSTVVAKAIPSVFNNFMDSGLTKLTIVFLHGPANQTYYVAGEVHRKGVDANPLENRFVVNFDAQGTGEVSLSRKHLDKLDLGKWGDKQSLSLKLVKQQGGWETISYAYSITGNNVIRIQGVDENGVVEIDLSKKDYIAGIPPLNSESWIAYMIDNTWEADVLKSMPKTRISKVLVIHNAADIASIVPVETIQRPSEWSVILDSNSAGITPLKYATVPQRGYTDVLVSKGKVTVPAKSSAVLVKH